MLNQCPWSQDCNRDSPQGMPAAPGGHADCKLIIPEAPAHGFLLLQVGTNLGTDGARSQDPVPRCGASLWKDVANAASCTAEWW